MRFLITFFITSIFFITMLISNSQPKIHKHFLIMPPNFKLENGNWNSSDLQTASLLRIGKKQQTKNQQAKTGITDITEGLQKELLNTKKTNNSQGKNANTDEIFELITQMVGTTQQYANSPKQTGTQTKNNTQKHSGVTPSEQSDSKLQNPLLDKPDSQSEISTQELLTNPKYKNELIAWNTWRSQLQNTIMEKSDIEANYGTIFYFMFDVDSNRNIKNIKIICTDLNDTASINNLRTTISGLRGNKILEFPKGTNRKSVKFSGGFLIGSFTQYSTPEDFNDIERIRSRY